MNSHKLIPYFIIVCVLGIMGCTKDNHKNNITECVGTVVEGITMNPLPNVTVAVTNGNRVLVSTITDDHGAFSLFVDFEKVTVEDSLLLDGRPGFPYLKKEALKGMGKEQYDYGNLFLYNDPIYDLKRFQYAGATYYVHPEVGEMTWENAMAFCDNLMYAGCSDWFLPDKEELFAMYIYKDEIGGFETYSYHNCNYWSSTTTYYYDGQYYYDDWFNYWYVDFSRGYVGYDLNQYNSIQTNHRNRVRPIRKDNGKNTGLDDTVETITTQFEQILQLNNNSYEEE